LRSESCSNRRPECRRRSTAARRRHFAGSRGRACTGRSIVAAHRPGA
jgi:hypothetical protein